MSKRWISWGGFGIIVAVGAVMSIGVSVSQTVGPSTKPRPLLTSPTSGPAQQFTDEDYTRRIAQLRKTYPKLKGLPFVVEKPFIIASEETPAQTKRWAEKTVRWATTKFKKQYFKNDPDKIITIWLFNTPATYKKGASLLSGYRPDTPYGYYEDEKQQMVMDIATGGGTLVHELFHAYIASNYPDCPTWINEGMGSLYEQCNERAGKIVGMTNWRLAGLKRAIRDKATIGFDKLAALSPRAFYGEGQSVRYAQARYLCYYLQQKNLLGKFFHEAKKQRNLDPTGYNTLVKVLGMTDEPAFRKQWEAYCLKLTFPETPTPRPTTR